MYIVLEIQSGETTSVLVNTYEERPNAEHKYHEILGYAAMSDVPMHSAVMLSQEGYYIKSELYDHIKKEVEPQVIPI